MTKPFDKQQLKQSSQVIRAPVELVNRINQYGAALEKQGVKLTGAPLMRNFAENAITPAEDVNKAFKIIGKQKWLI